MKRFKLGFLTLVSILGIGSAFASAHHISKLLTNYYSISDGTGGWQWVTINSLPDNVLCTPTVLNTLCTVTTATKPANNTVPSGFVPDHHINDGPF